MKFATMIRRRSSLSLASRARPATTVAEGQRHWLVSLAAMTAVFLASLSLHGVFDGWNWLPGVALTAVTVLAIMAAARSLRCPSFLVIVAGFLALAGVLIWQFFRNQSIFGVIPLPEARHRLALLLQDAEGTVTSELAPVLPGDGILLVTSTAIGLTAVLLDTLAITFRMSAMSGLPLVVVLSVPAVIIPESVGVPAFAAAATGYLLLLGSGQWRESRGKADRAAQPCAGHLARAAAIGAAALGLTLVLAAAIPGFNAGTFPQGSRLEWWATATGLDPSVTLGKNLRDPAGFGRITYATNAKEPLYLRLTTLESFSGQRWQPDQRLSSRRYGIREMGKSAGLPIRSENLITTRVNSRSFTSPWLLAPYAPVSVTELTGSWTWDPQTLTLLSANGETTARQSYQVLSSTPELSRELLAGIGPARQGEIDDQFTDLPEHLPPVIRETALNLTADETNPYSKAMAIQNYLRGSGFTYSLQAPVNGSYDGNSIGVIERFLDVKAGYCVQFAGTMAVMARLAGIPSRVAVGYAPGKPTGNIVKASGEDLREFAVDSRDAHAWPELYFRDAGWVRFEPTPSRGVVPGYARPPASLPGLPAEEDLASEGSPGPNALSSPTPAPGPIEPDTQITQDQSGVHRSLIGGGVLVLSLLAFVPFLARTVRSGRRQRRFLRSTPGHGAAGVAWAETSDIAADYGYPTDPTDTPRTFTNRVLNQARLEGSAAESFIRLRQAYEIQMYSAATTSQLTPEPASPTWTDVQRVVRALRRSSALPTRLKARLLPRSLWNRNHRGALADGDHLPRTAAPISAGTHGLS